MPGRFAVARVVPGTGALLHQSQQREPQAKSATMAGAIDDLHNAVHGLERVLRDRQTQSHTFSTAGAARGVRLAELGELVPPEAATLVFHVDQRRIVLGACAHPYHTVRMRELY